MKDFNNQNKLEFSIKWESLRLFCDTLKVFLKERFDQINEQFVQIEFVRLKNGKRGKMFFCIKNNLFAIRFSRDHFQFLVLTQLDIRTNQIIF